MSWDEEQACFESISTELSLLFSDLSAYEGEPEEASTIGHEPDSGPVPQKYEQVLQVREREDTVGSTDFSRAWRQRWKWLSMLLFPLARYKL